MPHLDPPSYRCPTHGHDLTPQVIEALEEEGPPVAYGKRERDFGVPVTCPGDGPDGGHELVCTGKYW